MSLATPTTQDINDNIIAQLQATLNQTIPLLPKAFNRVLSSVLAGVFVLLYKYGGFIFLQMFVRTASFSDTTINGIIVNPLVQWGRLIGVTDRTPATSAELLIDITVTNQTGTLPSGSQLLNDDNGVTYITLGDVALNAATVQATIQAISDQAGGSGAGAIGNLNTSDVVSFANPLANVSREALVVSQSVTGADAEAIEVYRQRIIDKFQKRPQGGAYSDYELWGEEVAGIINVYPYTSVNPGTIDLYSEASGTTDGIPTPAQLQAVQDSVIKDVSGLASRRPGNALTTSSAITRKAFDVTVTGLVATNLAAIQAQIDAAVIQFFLDIEPFIDGLTVPPRMDRITRSALIGLVDDIVAAVDGTFTDVTFEETLNPGAIDSYVLIEGEKAKQGNPVAFV